MRLILHYDISRLERLLESKTIKNVRLLIHFGENRALLLFDDNITISLACSISNEEKEKIEANRGSLCFGFVATNLFELIKLCKSKYNDNILFPLVIEMFLSRGLTLKYEDIEVKLDRTNIQAAKEYEYRKNSLRNYQGTYYFVLDYHTLLNSIAYLGKQYPDIPINLYFFIDEAERSYNLFFSPTSQVITNFSNVAFYDPQGLSHISYVHPIYFNFGTKEEEKAEVIEAEKLGAMNDEFMVYKLIFEGENMYNELVVSSHYYANDDVYWYSLSTQYAGCEAYDLAIKYLIVSLLLEYSFEKLSDFVKLIRPFIRTERDKMFVVNFIKQTFQSKEPNLGAVLQTF